MTGSPVIDAPRVIVIGGGLFGLTATVALAAAGCDVVVLERDDDVMTRASFVNQNRLHLGYHYPRSLATARETIVGSRSFREHYGAAVVREFVSYYAIAAEGSRTSPEEFVAFCDAAGLPLEPAWPRPGVVDPDLLAACWRTPEPIFDFHELRRIVIERLATNPRVTVRRRAPVVGIDVGAPHRVTLGSGEMLSADVVVNATYAQIRDVEALFGRRGGDLEFELCVMAVLSHADPIPPLGVTVMDGPFGSLVPMGRERGRFLLYDVERSVLQRRVAPVAPEWGHVTGFPELEMIERCSAYFPVLRSMHVDRSLVTTRTVIPHRDHDDARPTLLEAVAPGIYSIFSGKLTTCVDLADELVAELAVAGLAPAGPVTGAVR